MDTLFFWTSKFVWELMAPDSLLMISLVVGLLLLKRKRPRTAQRILGALLLVLLVAGIFPVDDWVFYPLETRFPTNPPLPERVDGIICLGGGEDGIKSRFWNQVEVADSGERLISFIALAKRFPQAKLVFTGGSGQVFHQATKATGVAERLFEDMQMDTSRLILERESRNTYENGKLSLALVQPQAGETWILITTAWHIPRAVGVFRKVGWPVIPYPVDHWSRPGHLLTPEIGLSGHLRDLRYGAKEWLGLLVYYATGKTSTLFPKPEASGASDG